ncbi:MAG: AAA family ATPase [Telmatospirillum sp.]|nr:AAA family ATPase [Telmatospirillum sp.]
MRILAIRGANLASLAGPFEIDFEAPPLADAGLFAITGPTGAGKSTVLDALSLALYDRLPRLANAARSTIGQGDEDGLLVSTDVRTILRHGAGQGYAEVDFVGCDLCRYRARWSVQRARRRADGRIQAQSLSLAALGDGTLLGGTKLETLAAIREKSGLDYEQFRRSVLLAQQDFDAFLKASPTQRAALLELMTGTDVYSRLSMAAYERTRDAKSTLDALTVEAGRTALLLPEERDAVMAEAKAAEEELAASVQEIGRLGTDIGWYRRLAQLREAVQAAEAGLEDAVAADQAMAPDRERLAGWRRARDCERDLREVERTAALVRELSAARSRAEAAATALAGEAEEARKDAERFRVAEEEAEARIASAGPDLDRASDLDAAIEAAAVHLSRMRDRKTTAMAAVDAQRTSAVRLAGQCDVAARDLRTLEEWLSGHAGFSDIARQMDRWLDGIAAHDRASRALNAADDRATMAERELAGLADGVRTARAVITGGEDRRTRLRQSLERVTADLRGLDGDEIERRRGDGAALMAALSDAGAELRAAEALAQTLADLRGRRRDALAERDRCARERAELDQDRVRADAGLADMRKMLALAQSAAGRHAAAMRLDLVAGEPCPVCGSREHPGAEAEETLVALVEAHRERVAAAEAEIRRIGDRRQELVAGERSAEVTLARADAEEPRLADDAAGRARRVDDTLARAAAAAGRAGIPLPDLRGDGWANRMEPVSDHVSGVAESLRADAEKLAALRSERDRLVDALARGDEEIRAAERRLAELDTATTRLDALIGESGRDRETQRAAMASVEAVLEAPLACLTDWRRDLRSAPDRLADRCRAAAGEWRQKEELLGRQRQTLDRLATDRAIAEAGLADAVSHAAEAGAMAAEAEAGHERLVAERAPLFGGRPTAEVRARMEAGRVSARDRHQTAQRRWATAVATAEGAAATARATIAQLAEAGRARDTAILERDRRLAERSLSLDEARHFLSLSPEAMVSLERRAAQMAEVAVAAHAVLGERRGAREAHEAAPGRPIRPAEVLETALAACEARRTTAQERLIGTRNRLAEDERRRQDAADLEERIRIQQGCHDHWKSISDLIGSADGARFRRYAQGLTLDRLLVAANIHLAELAPRYIVERPPGGELDLQVIDRDMGNEIRGVANLSGGERFLVSLALALGLASMSGHRTLVESLFIDEGFGALDANSLDIALSALESLQSSGRKVGVISHVQAMVDRIGVQIRVAKRGGGRSSVETIGVG